MHPASSRLILTAFLFLAPLLSAAPAHAADFDLVILDLHMPGMNGLEGLQRLKAKFPNLPTVVISGQATNEQAREALNKGASGFLPKDVSGEAMLKALELVLAGEVYVPSMALTLEGTAAGKYDSGGNKCFEPGAPEFFAYQAEQLFVTWLHDLGQRLACQPAWRPVTDARHFNCFVRICQLRKRTRVADRDREKMEHEVWVRDRLVAADKSTCLKMIGRGRTAPEKEPM